MGVYPLSVVVVQENDINSEITVLLGKTKMWHKRNNNEDKYTEVKKGGEEVIFLDEEKGGRRIKNE
jgi:hypothetical protein